MVTTKVLMDEGNASLGVQGLPGNSISGVWALHMQPRKASILLSLKQRASVPPTKLICLISLSLVTGAFRLTLWRFLALQVVSSLGL